MLIGCNQTEQKNDTEQKIDLKEEGLKSKVKSVRINSYNVIEKFGKIEKESKGLQITEYNLQGNEIKMNFYNSDGRLSSKSTSRYDEKGNEIEINIYNSTGSLLYSKYTYQYQYDDQDNWVEKLKYRGDKPIEITTREIEYYK